MSNIMKLADQTTSNALIQSFDAAAGVDVHGSNNNVAGVTSYIGQLIRTGSSTPQNVPGTTTVFANILTLAPADGMDGGDWDIWGVVTFTLNGATGSTNVRATINTSSTGSAGAAGDTRVDGGAILTTGTTLFIRIRSLKTAATSIFFNIACNYSTGTPQYTYQYYARRRG